MKKAGKPAAKAVPKPGKAAAKAAGKLAGKQVGTLLYTFIRGVLTTCEIPSMKLETHSQSFRKHRCGLFNGKFYLLEENQSYYANESDSLREVGTLKVYDSRSHSVEKTVKTCKCNQSTVPLLITGAELIDYGLLPRIITLSSGDRRPFSTLSCPLGLEGSGACIVLNKTIFLAGGKYPPPGPEYTAIDDDENITLPAGIYSVTSSRSSQVAEPFDPVLEKASMLPLSASEFVVIGVQEGAQVVYLFNAGNNTLTRQGVCSRQLGQSFSSCVQDGMLYAFFDSGVLVKCDLRTGMMKALNVQNYQRVKQVIWAMSKTCFRRLPQVLYQAIAGY